MKMHVARSCLVVAMLSLAVSGCSADETDSDDQLDVHLKVGDQASPADVGLPAYPGSRAYKEGDNTGSGANLGFSTSSFGLKVVAMNLEASDEPRQVAAFYRRALSKYGAVLECRGGTSSKRATDAERSDELSCDSGDHEAGSIVYKVGTEKNQRIVAIKPHGSGARFSLVHLVMRGESK